MEGNATNQKILSGLFFCTLVITCFPKFSFSQNIAANGNFESFGTCPTNENQLSRATGWAITAGSPDFFHNCGATVPNNNWGSQLPQNGNGYGAGLTYHSSGFREQGHHLFSSAMIPGATYYVSYWINRGESSQYASNRQGLFFSTSPTSPINFCQVYNNTVIFDKVNWIQITATYVAGSANTYYTYGNFYDNANTTFVQDCPGCSDNWAHYYFDNICISTNPADCGLAILAPGMDLVGKENKERQAELSWFYPNSTIIKEFIIERSFDGGEVFEEAGKVLKPTTPGVNQNFYFNDDVPLTQTCAYYRIRAIEESGTTHVSNQVEVRLKNSCKEVSGIFPNPAMAGNEIFLPTSNHSASVAVQINNLEGKIVWSSTLNANPEAQFSSFELPEMIPGIYVVTYNDDVETKTDKLIVR